eukprot:CAMPEP_0184288518 /NCGR_PEP_ID=MMETSP1049-20130417/1047_1 /TAXON_ID=77928 /ORGANISM="Proteomonas sulcata, Strain CCMP704" /LENGTH=155 /DNA_ID=CAMNT_0026594969 /DNA_START=159 /DNA_END=627 /DNA_ORIENTATION=+
MAPAQMLKFTYNVRTVAPQQQLVMLKPVGPPMMVQRIVQAPPPAAYYEEYETFNDAPQQSFQQLQHHGYEELPRMTEVYVPAHSPAPTAPNCRGYSGYQGAVAPRANSATPLRAPYSHRTPSPDSLHASYDEEDIQEEAGTSRIRGLNQQTSSTD